MKLIFRQTACGGMLSPVTQKGESRASTTTLDDAARTFMVRTFDVDPWFAIELPLPDSLDIDDLRRVRDVVYAIIQALGGTLDDSLPFIGRLAEIDRRIALLTHL